MIPQTQPSLSHNAVGDSQGQPQNPLAALASELVDQVEQLRHSH